jgi:hypothetical protein
MTNTVDQKAKHMTVRYYNGQEALTWISLHTDVTWVGLRYDAGSRRFVIGAFRYHPEKRLGYLVLYDPYYIRFADGLSSTKLFIGADAWQQLRRPLPVSIDPLNFESVVIQGEHDDACVLCMNFSLYEIEEAI